MKSNKMKKVLFLSPEMPKETGGGRFTETLLSSLKAVPGTNVTEYFAKFPLTTHDKIVSMLHFCIYGMSPKVEKDVLALMEKEHFDLVFVNFTAYGFLMRKIRRLHPSVKIVSMAIDVEVKLQLDVFRLKGLVRGLPTLINCLIMYLNERTMARVVDRLFCLNQRDADGFIKVYGRSADAILPLMIEDKCSVAEAESVSRPARPYGLFVASSLLRPNMHGIRWFLENVAVHTNIHYKIVGLKFEDHKEELEALAPNVEVIGTVSDPAPYYYGASFVIAPIFTGSGMKTKTAEALMFGKHIFAADEALEGYGNLPADCVWRCNTPDEFVKEINDFVKQDRPLFYRVARNIYNEGFSAAVFRGMMAKAIDEVV